MTLLETERLIRKISELLQQSGSPEMASKLAADYAAACHAANLRLQQCEAMIKAGDRPQAIQLAETAPVLLDLVTLLEFHGADEWRGYCQKNSLPMADRIDARSVQALNQCYAQGISTDHPLYANYRSAVLSRNDDVALKTLQSITRLNPADANATSELARLDAKVLAARLQHLGSSLEGAEPVLLVAEIEAIEAFGFKTKPDGEVWRKAQAVRCGCLLEEATRLKSNSRWSDALAKIDFIHRLQDEFKIQLPEAALTQLRGLETWARGELEKDKKEKQFQSLVTELHHRIHQSEEKDTSARYVKLPELRDDYEAIHKVWRSLTEFTRPIPEDAGSSFRKRSALLEVEILRRTSIQRRMIIASAVTVLVIGGFLVWLVVAQMKTRDFSRQLREAVTQRQMHAADKLLERAHSEKIGDGSVIATAETFATREHALQANFETAFKKLPSQLTGEADAYRIATVADQLAEAHIALAALAPDLKAENEPRLQAFEKQWQDYLLQSSTTVNGLLEQWVSIAEETAGALDYRAPLEKTRTQMTSLTTLMQKITDAESGFTNHLTIRNDLLQRSTTVRARFSACQGELKKLDDGMTAIQKAHGMEEFSQGITLTASSEFSASPAATAALAIQSLNANMENTLRSLINATNPATWAYIQKTHSTPFIPELVMPAEHQICEGLNNDPAVNARFQLYRLKFDQDGAESADWITTGPFEATDGSLTKNFLTGEITEHRTSSKEIKAWAKTASAKKAVFSECYYAYFNNHLTLLSSPDAYAGRPVFSFEKIGQPNDTVLFNSIELNKIFANGNSYAKPLLGILDSIKDSREGSPLFRAYLFLRLTEVMNLQPDAWGLAFCPSARTHAAQIKRIVGPEFGSGDWFVSAKVNACSQKLEEFFDAMKAVSYSKQAEGLLAIEQAVAKDGLQYGGFVGLDGKANFIEGQASGEVFGYASAHKEPVLLAAKIPADGSLLEQAMPLSPLFVLANSSKGYLTQAGVDTANDSFKGVMPPLFQSPPQP